MAHAVDLTIRFSASLPDLSLTIEEAQTTSVLTLICRIREQLPAPQDGFRVRLIYAGRVLVHEDSLVTALRLQAEGLSGVSVKSDVKGKAPAKPTAASDRKYYIHANLSDALAPAALDKERSAAAAADSGLAAAAHTSRRSEDERRPRSSFANQPGQARVRGQLDTRNPGGSSAGTQASPGNQMPQGFDRLLSAGLSAMEVASLRSQFLGILAHTHTPDNMPDAFELRELEERWLDNESDGQGPGASGAADGGGGGGGGGGGLLGRLGGAVSDEDTSGLDDMLWGNIIGFFWPIGAVIWLMREEGVWTQRRKIAVVTGALVNLAFSVMRAAS